MGWGCECPGEGGRRSWGSALGEALGQAGGMQGCALNPGLDGGTGICPESRLGGKHRDCALNPALSADFGTGWGHAGIVP